MQKLLMVSSYSHGGLEGRNTVRIWEEQSVSGERNRTSWTESWRVGCRDTAGWPQGIINRSGIHNDDLASHGDTRAYPLPDVVKISGPFHCPVRRSFHLTKGLGVFCGKISEGGTHVVLSDIHVVIMYSYFSKHFSIPIPNTFACQPPYKLYWYYILNFYILYLKLLFRSTIALTQTSEHT